MFFEPGSAPQTRPIACFAIILACLLSLFSSGVTSLKADAISNDEFNSLARVHGFSQSETYSISQTVQSVAAYSQQHGPLYFVLLNIWQKLAGDDLFSARYLSVLFGLLAVALACRLAGQNRQPELAVVAVVVMAFLSYFVYYTHSARMYTLLALVSGWVLFSYWQVVSCEGPVRRSRWPSLFVSTAMILYIHYFGIMILAAVGIYHLLLVKKGRRWLLVSLLMVTAVLLFVPWLPVALDGFSNRLNLAGSRLPLHEAIRIMLVIYANGNLPLLLLTVVFVPLNHKRLDSMAKYILIVTATTVVLMVAMNELTPILVERRMRYTTVFALPFSCAFAIGLTMIPGGKLLRIPLLCAWIFSFFAFTSSEELFIYTNGRDHNLDKSPHYQDLLYESSIRPGQYELILSFHPNDAIADKTLRYYAAVLANRNRVGHITYDDLGELLTQNMRGGAEDLAAIAERNRGIWVVYNPQQTELETMQVYTDWFQVHFKFCQRFVEKENSIIDYYVKRLIPCELITDDQPLGIQYAGGTELANVEYELSSKQLDFYFWWRHSMQQDYSLTLQVFDQEGAKVDQVDAVIEGEPLDIVSFEVSSLPAGDYVVKLIVYDRWSLKSQPGTILSSQQRFEREVEVARFPVDD